MKAYRILTSFKGSQDGLGDGEDFVAGTTAKLSDDLARIAIGERWAEEPATGGMVPSPEKLPLIGEKPSGVVIIIDTPLAEDRETKVIGPDETKVDQPDETKAESGLAAMTYKDLLALAKERGLKAIGMKKDALVAALDGKE